jgi:hypothetical protein
MQIDKFEVQQANVNPAFAVTTFAAESHGGEAAAWDAAVAYAQRLVGKGAPADDITIVEFSGDSPIFTRDAGDWQH